MKRLLILTLLMTPLAVATIRQFVETSRTGVPVRPRMFHLADTGNVGGAESLVVVQNKYPMATAQSATEAAWTAAQEQLSRKLADHGILQTWQAPRALLSEMVQEGQLECVEKDYGDVFIKTLVVDQSEAQVARLVEAHEREVAGRRLVKLGGLLSFVLVCLATMSAYIRADEATKGYYTKSLRAASLAAVGAAGTAVYFWLA